MIFRRSFNYYLTITVIPGLFLFFLILGVVGRLDMLGASFCFLFFGGIVYAYFGRYLAVIELHEKRIEVRYVLPWNSSITYTFEKLRKVDHKDMPALNYTNRWYRSYQVLILENEIGEVCQIRYNINSSEDEMLLNKVRELLG